jgi:hypothetical protein
LRPAAPKVSTRPTPPLSHRAHPARRTYIPKADGSQRPLSTIERGMDKSGIRLLGPGDITGDDELPDMTDATLGIVTALHYPRCTVRR